MQKNSTRGRDRAQFLGLAAGIMRHILVDQARYCALGKGARHRHAPLDEGLDFSPVKIRGTGGFGLV